MTVRRSASRIKAAHAEAEAVKVERSARARGRVGASNTLTAQAQAYNAAGREARAWDYMARGCRLGNEDAMPGFK
jgi:hypothetical protein